MKKEYISKIAWGKIFNFLKEQKSIYIKEERCCQSFIEAIYWMTRTGAQWRELPNLNNLFELTFLEISLLCFQILRYPIEKKI
jgi:hypothetical protein